MSVERKNDDKEIERMTRKRQYNELKTYTGWSGKINKKYLYFGHLFGYAIRHTGR